MYSNHLFKSCDYFWFQQYSLSIAIALDNTDLIKKQINQIKLLDYSTDRFVDFFCLLNSSFKFSSLLLDKLDLQKLVKEISLD